jgi:hypothetical protein
MSSRNAHYSLCLAFTCFVFVQLGRIVCFAVASTFHFRQEVPKAIYNRWVMSSRIIFRSSLALKEMAFVLAKSTLHFMRRTDQSEGSDLMIVKKQV